MRMQCNEYARTTPAYVISARRQVDGEGEHALKILISAYACEPGKGSEPGIGWNIACSAAKRHDVWVLTRESNRGAIEAALQKHPVSRLHPVYYDLPSWTRWWKRGERGMQAYYYLWQLGAYGVMRRLHRAHGFDVTQHATFGRYWVPSLLPLLPTPFIWGPIGGGEDAPHFLWRDLSRRGRRFERTRQIARVLGEHDPLVRLAARRSVAALAVTEETAHRLTALGTRNTMIFSAMGLQQPDFEELTMLPPPPPAPIRFLTMGRAVHWKGVHLGLRAFAACGVSDAEYWIIGGGPALPELRRLAAELGVASRVVFHGMLPRREALEALAHCHVLVHPSLHDSGGWVCLEAMAAARPVVCLHLGGPAEMVSDETGIRINVRSALQVHAELTTALRNLAHSEPTRDAMGRAARTRVRQRYLWEAKGDWLNSLYTSAANPKRRYPDPW
jgi:glycosyltransferase involved in cell wall biosynthesis